MLSLESCITAAQSDGDSLEKPSEARRRQLERARRAHRLGGERVNLIGVGRRLADHFAVRANADERLASRRRKAQQLHIAAQNECEVCDHSALMKKRIAVLEGLDPGVRRQTRQCRFVDPGEERRSAQLARACRLRRARTGASLLRGAVIASHGGAGVDCQARASSRSARNHARHPRDDTTHEAEAPPLPPAHVSLNAANGKANANRQPAKGDARGTNRRTGYGRWPPRSSRNTACSPKRFQTHQGALKRIGAPARSKATPRSMCAPSSSTISTKSRMVQR